MLLNATIALAGAAKVPVYYDVEDKPLRTGAPAGTMLTVELHALADCSDPAVYSQSLPVEALKIDATKTVTPKNAAKSAKTDRLTAVLVGVDVPQNTFLKVTGSGIMPVGGDCQAQVLSGAVVHSALSIVQIIPGGDAVTVLPGTGLPLSVVAGSAGAGLLFNPMTGNVSVSVEGDYMASFGFSPGEINDSIGLVRNGLTVFGSIVHNGSTTNSLVGHSMLVQLAVGDTLSINNLTGTILNLSAPDPAGELTTVAYLTLTQIQ